MDRGQEYESHPAWSRGTCIRKGVLTEERGGMLGVLAASEERVDTLGCKAREWGVTLGTAQKVEDMWERWRVTAESQRERWNAWPRSVAEGMEERKLGEIKE